MVKETRFGDVVFRDGQGFSEAPPTQQEIIREVLKPTRRRSSRGGSSSSSPAPSVDTRQSTIQTPTRSAGEVQAQRETEKEAQQESIKKTFLIREQRRSTMETPTQAAAAPGVDTRQSSLQTPTRGATRLSEARRFKRRVVERGEVQQQRDIQEVKRKKERGERFRIGLSEKEKQLTTEDVIKGRFKEVGTGISKVGIAVGEGSVNLISDFGVQLIEFDEQGKRIPQKRFEFKGDFAKRIKEEPLTTGSLIGGALVIAPLAAGSVGTTIKSISTIGAKATFAETLSSFSPLKIRPGTFGGLTSAKASQAKFDVVSQKLVKDGKTLRFVSGRGGEFDDIFLFSRQVSTKGTGVATTTIISQETKLVGGKLIPQIRTIQAKQLFTSKPGAATKVFSGDLLGRVDLSNVIGSGSKTLTTIISQTLVTPRGVEFTANLLKAPVLQTAAGTAIQKDSFTAFAAGKATGFGGILRVPKANIRGVEIDITNIFGGGAGTTIVGAGPSSKQITSTAAQQVSAALSAPKIVPPKITGPSINILALPLLAPAKLDSQQAAIVEEFQMIDTIQIPKIKQEPIPTTTQTLQTLTSPIVEQKPRQRSRGRTRQDAIPGLDVKLIQIPEQEQRTTPGQTLRQRLQLVPGFARPPTINLAIPRIIDKPIIGIGLRLPRISAPRATGNFGVQVRRGGEFFFIGNFKTQQRAFERGLDVTTKTLAATFKLTGPGIAPGAPAGFRTKKTGLETLFIEKRGRRLSKKSETREIQLAKTRKSKKKKKKK